MRKPLILPIRFYSLLVAMLFLSCFVFLCFEQSHFDSDQAISGIMAKHLSEFRHFPIYTYGAKYVLGFETWIAAPFMALWGASVFTLKLPLFILNSITLCLLAYLLKKETKLSLMELFFSVIFFVLVSPIGSSRILHAAVGVPTSFLACLLVWVFRNRPIAIGLLLGLVVPIRPFVLYAFASILFLEGLSQGFNLKRYWNQWKVTGGIFLSLVFFFKVIGKFGVNYKGPAVPAMVIKDPVSFYHSFEWLITQNLPAIFGLKTEKLADYNIASSLSVGHELVVPFVILLIFLTCVFVLRWIPKLSRKSISDFLLSEPFAVFLMCIGLLSGFVYTEFTRGAENIMLIRYTILCVFFPIGYSALFFKTELNRNWRRGWIVTIGILFVLNATDHIRLIHEYFTHEPLNPYRELVNHLETSGIHYGEAPFWTASHVSFFSQEKILLTESDFARVDEYLIQIQNHPESFANISDGVCRDPLKGENFLRWCIERSH
jgi:hypothetical protein